MAIAPQKLQPVPGRLLTALHRAGASEVELRQAYGLDAGIVARAVAVEAWSPDNTEQEMSDKQDIPTMPPLRPRRSLPHRLIGGAGITRSQKQ